MYMCDIVWWLWTKHIDYPLVINHGQWQIRHTCAFKTGKIIEDKQNKKCISQYKKRKQFHIRVALAARTNAKHTSVWSTGAEQHTREACGWCAILATYGTADTPGHNNNNKGYHLFSHVPNHSHVNTTWTQLRHILGRGLTWAEALRSRRRSYDQAKTLSKTKGRNQVAKGHHNQHNGDLATAGPPTMEQGQELWSQNWLVQQALGREVGFQMRGLITRKYVRKWSCYLREW